MLLLREGSYRKDTIRKGDDGVTILCFKTTIYSPSVHLKRTHKKSNPKINVFLFLWILVRKSDENIHVWYIPIWYNNAVIIIW